MSRHQRLTCPQCDSPVPMRFIFPAPRTDPCEELNAWRFQRCNWCGWRGDAVTGTAHEIYNDIWHRYLIDGKHYDRLRDWLIVLELC